MTNEELKLKVINAQAKVEKKATIVKKHRDRLVKMVTTGADEYDIEWKRQEIKEAEKKLEEARQVFANWKSKLDKKISENEYLEANAPAVLKDFLESWKRRAISYHREKRIRFIEYRQDLKKQEREARLDALRTLPSLERYRELYQGREPSDNELANLWPRREVDAFLHERGLDYRQIEKKLNDFGDPITFRLLEIRDEKERETWLEKAMEEEKKAKLLDLIQRIMGTVGTITDAAALEIGDDGDINGYISGTEGRAKVKTIGAGGYNIQCFHFRTLIHEIK